MQFCDEQDFGFGWIEDDFQQRVSHALLVEDGVWLVDPLAWPEAESRVSEHGVPRGVIQLLDRHNRDAQELAGRLGVPHLRVPLQRVEGSPFELIPLVARLWQEAALWWPARRVLVCADAVGTAPYFRAPKEPLGVHPLLRFAPPKRLRLVHPLHILCGLGEGVHGEDAAPLLHEALRTARRRLPAAWLNGIRKAR